MISNFNSTKENLASENINDNCILIRIKKNNSESF